MLNLRTDFPFKACGLDGLSEADKDAFITDVFAELELRVGRRLSEGLSDAALDEFERLVDGGEEYCRDWLRQHEPEYQDQPEFIRLATSGHPSPHHEVARLIWLVRNRPDYRSTVMELTQELIAECVRRFNEEA